VENFAMSPTGGEKAWGLFGGEFLSGFRPGKRHTWWEEGTKTKGKIPKKADSGGVADCKDTH